MYDSPIESGMRDATATIKTVPLTQNADTPILSVSRNRIGVRIWVLGGVTYINVVPMTAISQGIVVPSLGNVQISQWFDGDLATNEFHAFTATASVVLIIEEVIGCKCATGH